MGCSRDSEGSPDELAGKLRAVGRGCAGPDVACDPAAVQGRGRAASRRALGRVGDRLLRSDRAQTIYSGLLFTSEAADDDFSRDPDALPAVLRAARARDPAERYAR